MLEENYEIVLLTEFEIARTLQEMKRYEEALVLFQKVSINLKSEGNTRTQFAKEGYALCLKEAGKFQESRQMFEEVLNHREKTLGEDHLLTLRVRRCLGDVCFDQKDWKGAIKWYRSVIEKSKHQLDYNTVIAKSDLASSLYNSGEISEAIKWFRITKENCLAVWGDDYPYKEQIDELMN